MFSCSTLPFPRKNNEVVTSFLPEPLRLPEKKTILSRLHLVNPVYQSGIRQSFVTSIFREQQASASHFFTTLGENGLAKHVLRVENCLLLRLSKSSKLEVRKCLRWNTEQNRSTVDRFQIKRTKLSKKNTGFTEVVVCFVESAAV